MVKTKAAKKRYPPHFQRNGTHTQTPTDNKTSATLTPTSARRPIRPVDRQKMLDWLLDKLRKGEMEKSLSWEEEGKVFRVRWPHAASHAFDERDAELFKAWAKHSGLYKEGDPDADHRKWKANFRCAIHSLPDLEELKKKDGRKGPNACRVYRIRDEPLDKKKKKMRTQCQTSQVSSDEERGEDSDSTLDYQDSTCSDLPSTVKEEVLQSLKMEQKNIPDFSKIGLGVIIQPNHFSGGCCIVKKEDPPATPLTIITPSPTTITTPFTSTTPFTTTTNNNTASSSLSSFPFNIINTSTTLNTSNITTTTATTTTPAPFQLSSYPSPSPSHSPSPPHPSSFTSAFMAEDSMMEDMVPVGVMQVAHGVSSSQGSLSSFSPSASAELELPATPPQEPEYVQQPDPHHHQVQGLVVTEEEFKSIFGQGLELDIGAMETISGVELVEEQGREGGQYLDISHCAPPAVPEPEVVLDFLPSGQYVSMDVQYAAP